MKLPLRKNTDSKVGNIWDIARQLIHERNNYSFSKTCYEMKKFRSELSLAKAKIAENWGGNINDKYFGCYRKMKIEDETFLIKMCGHFYHRNRIKKGCHLTWKKLCRQSKLYKQDNKETYIISIQNILLAS